MDCSPENIRHGQAKVFLKRLAANHGADHSESNHLGPQYLWTKALQKDAADDNKEISQGVEICEPLNHGGHIGDRKHEAGEKDRWEIEKECAHHRLLLGLTYCRNGSPIPGVVIR